MSIHGYRVLQVDDNPIRKKEGYSISERVNNKRSFYRVIGNSEAMQEVYETINMVIDTDSTILLLGDSGTGKELIARTIHYHSLRRGFPFIPLNCGAIPGELLESELFGHEKGAFTGAVATRQGRFERAHRGIIFLDEIAEIPVHLQVKLLRIIQEREFERVGGNRTIRLDVRVIAATNSNLEEAVKKGRFRKDLYYRLNVIPIVIPPLRKRKKDIPLLVDHFLHITAHKKKKRIRSVSEEAMDILINYPWPGNVRELENVVERVIILKQDSGPVVSKDLPSRIRGLRDNHNFSLDIPEGGIKLTKMVDDLEKELIEKALNKTGGVKSEAAKLLGINRTTLIEKMKKKGMLAKASRTTTKPATCTKHTTINMFP
ncbi:MAG: sigma-54 interaction domain-containing protein [Thermodesulfobacteriota bacterium]